MAEQHARGRIEVDSYEPKPYDEATDGPALVEVDVCEKFIGDIEGEGVVRFLQAQRHDGSASFVGGREGLRSEGGFTADLGQGAEIALTTGSSEGMNLGIIGAGSLGTALGKRLSGAGHAILYGTGAEPKPAAALDGAEVGTNSEAAAFSDVVVLAVPFAAIDEAMPSDGELAGKIVWSCVNALKPDFSGLAVGFETSAAEEVASRAPRARVVEAIPPFASAIAAGSLPYDHGLRPSVFVAGDDAGAKRAVERLIEDLGAMPVVAGPLTSARYIEPAMMLLVSLAYAGEPRDIGLRLLERTSA